MFSSYFLLKKENCPISAFVQSLFSTNKGPKVVNLPLTDETLCLSFWRPRQYKWLFHSSKLSSGSYVSRDDTTRGGFSAKQSFFYFLQKSVSTQTNEIRINLWAEREFIQNTSIQSLKMPKFLKLRMPKCVLKIEIIHYK